MDLAGSLRQYFGHTAFRDGQQELVETVLAGRDLLAVMPTGSGKSLGFQLPALLLPGTTLVVSPLISLMKDQVDELNRRGIRAAALHSALSSDARRDALQQARTGECQLLYVAPERFASDYFLRTLQDISISRFVIDEAHCVSEWGHDFRPDYRRLKEAAGVCRRSDGRAGRPPMAAFTATATPEVREDIVQLLGLDAPQVVVAGFDRPNISLSVRPVSGDIEKHQLLPQLIGSGRALVYAATRKKAEAAAETLMAAGIDAAAYHAGLVDTRTLRGSGAFHCRLPPHRLCDERVRHGHRSARRRDGRASRHPRIARGVLPGDRPRWARWAPGDRNAALELRRRADARVPDRPRERGGCGARGPAARPG